MDCISLSASSYCFTRAIPVPYNPNAAEEIVVFGMSILAMIVWCIYVHTRVE